MLWAVISCLKGHAFHEAWSGARHVPFCVPWLRQGRGPFFDLTLTGGTLEVY